MIHNGTKHCNETNASAIYLGLGDGTFSRVERNFPQSFHDLPTSIRNSDAIIFILQEREGYFSRNRFHTHYTELLDNSANYSNFFMLTQILLG